MKAAKVGMVGIRWFIENCMEIKLSNGKTIIVDPMVIKSPEDTDNQIAKEYATGYDVNDLEGCDYIMLTHIHGDHIGSLKALHERFKDAPILVNGWCAYPLAEYLDLPLGAFIPMTDGEEYSFDGFKVKWLQGRHTAKIGEKSASETVIGTTDLEIYVNRLGTIYNSNFIIELDNSMKLAMDGGRYEPNLSRLDIYKPNIVFIHSNRDPKTNGSIFVDAARRSGAQYIFALTAQILGDNTGVSEDTANAMLHEAGLPCNAIVPECGKWYDFSMGVAERD